MGPSKRRGWRKRTQLGLCAESALEIFTMHATKVVLSAYGSVKTQAKVTSKKKKPEYVMKCTGSPADAPTELLPLQIKLYAYYALPVQLAARLGLPHRRSDMLRDYVIVLLTQQLLSRRSDLTFSVFGLVIW